VAMPDYDRLLGNLQTVFVEMSDFSFHIMEQAGGNATRIRFCLPDHVLLRGDVLVVLDGSDIKFHGMISSVEPEGWAIASDNRGSNLPVVHT
jgi:hypothetical protein